MKKAKELSRIVNEFMSWNQSIEATSDLKLNSLDEENFLIYFLMTGSLRGGEGDQETTQWLEHSTGGNLWACTITEKLTKTWYNTLSILIGKLTTACKWVREQISS